MEDARKRWKVNTTCVLRGSDPVCRAWTARCDSKVRLWVCRYMHGHPCWRSASIVLATMTLKNDWNSWFTFACISRVHRWASERANLHLRQHHQRDAFFPSIFFSKEMNYIVALLAALLRALFPTNAFACFIETFHWNLLLLVFVVHVPSTSIDMTVSRRCRVHREMESFVM